MKTFASLTLSPFALAAALAVTTLPAAAQTAGQTVYPATLAGHALLPAKSFIPAPQDAPVDL